MHRVRADPNNKNCVAVSVNWDPFCECPSRKGFYYLGTVLAPLFYWKFSFGVEVARGYATTTTVQVHKDQASTQTINDDSEMEALNALHVLGARKFSLGGWGLGYSACG